MQPKQELYSVKKNQNFVKGGNKQRKYESINVSPQSQHNSLVPYVLKDRKESSMSSTSHIKLNNLISRINDLKSNIYKLNAPK
jgi:hypothetical protein